MRRLMSMIEHRRVDLTSLVTHRFALDDIEAAFTLFSRQQDGVLKVALYPDRARLAVKAPPQKSWPSTNCAEALRLPADGK
jgi:hypothetical protein